MNIRSQIYPADIFFGKTKEEKSFESNGFERVEATFDEVCSRLSDVHLKQGVGIHYLRVSSKDGPAKIDFSGLGTVLSVLQGSEFGILLTVGYENRKYTIWLPSASGQFHFDKFQRISSSERYDLTHQWEFSSNVQLTLSLSGSPGMRAIIPYMIIDNSHEQFTEEITSLNNLERCLYIKSEWFSARVPSDVWKYLINGSIYDPRSHKSIGKRFKCQQCAYAWWTYFGFLNAETGKKIHDILQDQVAYSVLMDMTDTGEWGHGFWSDDIETHARFHLDGLHLLISQYEKTREAIWLEAAERGVSFLSTHLMEPFDDGSLWFLHDTIEKINKNHHFKSALFGKSSGNSLCINTHVQALTVLHRLRQVIPARASYGEMFEKGVRALRRVLACNSGEAFFKILVPWIVRNITRTECHSNASRLMHGFEARLIKMFYWPLRRQFPRIVQPGGFTERDLTLVFFSHSYHISNMKDFLTLYHQESMPWLRHYIEEGVKFICEFVQKMGVSNALRSGVHYVELIDVLYLHNELFGDQFILDINLLEQKIYHETGGFSLDHCILKAAHREQVFCLHD